MTGLVTSNGDARRQVKAGGLKVNDLTVSDEKMLLTANDLREGVIKLSLGRKKHVLLKPVCEPAQRVCVIKLWSKLSGFGMNLRNSPGAIAVTGLTVTRGELGGPLAS